MNYLEDVLRFCRKHEKWMKLAVITLVVITALVFFGAKGENEEIVVVQDGETLMEQETTDQSQSFELSDDSEVETETVAKIVVDIDGCVKKAGVYEVDEGTRLYEVIQLAGGLTKSADTTLINQAEVLFDGQKIVIPEKVETTGNDDVKGTIVNGGMTADGRININQADAETLQEIPGVGPATAENILAYRAANGKFISIEELKNVSGIGEKTFDKMKDKITI